MDGTLEQLGDFHHHNRGLGGVVVELSPPTSEAADSNLGPGVSCWNVGSYLLMPVGLQ